MTTSEKLREKRLRRKKNKENKIPKFEYPPDAPVVQPLVVHSSPFNWEDFMIYYRSLELFTASNPVRPIKILPLKQFYHIDVGWSRSFLANLVLHESKATHICFLDSDMLFNHDTILNLLKHNKKITSGLYFTHGKTPSYIHEATVPVMYTLDEIIPPVKPKYIEELYNKIEDCDSELVKMVKNMIFLNTHRVYRSITNFDPYKLVEADAVGTGCLLIHVDILKKLEEYLLLFEEMADIKESGFTSMRMFFQTTPFCTEDITFSAYVREILNEKIYVDPSVICGHLTKSIVDMNDFIFNKRREVGEVIGFVDANKLDNMDVIKYNLVEKKKEMKK